MKHLKMCPICDEGNLVVQYDQEEAEYKGVKKNIPMAICVCSSCGSEVATKDEVKHNKRAMLAFRKEVDGLLSGEAIKAIRVKYALTQKMAGKIFGGGPIAFNKYENNDVVQSEAMDSLLRVASVCEDVVQNLAAIKGVHLGSAFVKQPPHIYPSYPREMARPVVEVLAASLSASYSSTSASRPANWVASGAVTKRVSTRPNQPTDDWKLVANA